MQKVGKLNSSIDIIPLQGSSGDYKSKSMDNKHKIENSHRFFKDQLLISRVQTYMHENENRVYIDVNEMADTLQRKYRDYRGKKRSAFRALVRKAYDELTEMFAKKSSRDWYAYEDDDDDDEVDVESDPQPAILGDVLLKMFKKSKGKQNGNSSDKELIDISSDDDVEKCDPKSDAKAEDTVANKNLQENTNSVPAVQKSNDSKEDRQSAQTSKNEVSIPKTQTEITTRKRQREKENDSGQLPLTKRVKTIPITEPKVTFADVGGNDKVLKTVCKLLAHIKHPEIFKQLGISPLRGFLLHGPPGCGKTLLAHAIAGELAVPLLKVAAPELVAGVSGESEARIRELFDQGIAIAPCVLFLDEIDAVAPHRATAQREMERRIVAQLLSCLDELSARDNGDRVLVIGATNRPDSLDPALRRAGRFDREVCLGIPDKDARAKILAVHTEKVALAPNISLSTIASLTPGFVGADLVALIREAALAAVDRIFEDLNETVPAISISKSPEISEIDPQTDKEVPAFENSGNIVDDVTTAEPPTSIEDTVSSMSKTQSENSNVGLEMDVTQEPSKSPELSSLLTWLRNEPPLSKEKLGTLCIEDSDFEVALRVVQPSAKREGFVTVPDVTWDDVGSLQDIRQELQMAILAPVRHAEQFAALGLSAATGVLLCGPPGCGKTLLAKAIANEAGINFISVKGPELLNMYVGESEKAVRQCFMRARNSAPCVIFFDELDALCPKRTEGDNSATSRVVNQMLTEMDGVESRQGVFLMAASNRPDIIDPAVLRPGRLDKILYVGLPTAADRVDILRALTKNGTKPKLAADINLGEVGYNEKCDGFTGADLASLIREAGIEALKELMTQYHGQPEICMRHIANAFDKVRPSVHEKEIKHYEKLRKLYSVRKDSEVTPMDTPLETPIVDVIMEPMET